MGTLRRIATLFRNAFKGWSADQVPRLGAALSYYTLFSLAPLLIVAMAVAGFVFGEEAARGEVMGQLRGLLGEQGAGLIQQMLQAANDPEQGRIAAIVGGITFFLGATGVFLELQGALNTVWNVRRKPGGGIWRMLKDRIISFGMVLGVGFLLLVSLVVSAALAALSRWMEQLLPGTPLVWQGLSIVVSYGVITLLFAMIYKVLPDVHLQWRHVWNGAAFTALFFTIGKFLIGLYLGQSTVASAYGAAGSVVVLLLWVYYSAQVILFGAEFTQAWVQLNGERLRPKSYAEAVPVWEQAGGEAPARAVPPQRQSRLTPPTDALK